MSERERLRGLVQSLASFVDAGEPVTDNHAIGQEAALLREFSHTYSNVMVFSSHRHCLLFTEVLRSLTANRLLNTVWASSVEHRHLASYLQALRVLLRDVSLKVVFTEASGVTALCSITNGLIQIYMDGREGAQTALAILEAGSSFMKLVGEGGAYRVLVQSGYPQMITRLLRVDDARMQRIGLKCICTFLNIKKAITHFIGNTCAMDVLHVLERSQDQEIKMLAAQIALRFAGSEGGREDLIDSDALSIITPELDCKDAKTLQCLVHTVYKLASHDKGVRDEFRITGGIQTIVACLRVLNGRELSAKDTSLTEGLPTMVGSTSSQQLEFPAVANRPGSAGSDKSVTASTKLSFKEEEVMVCQHYICYLCIVLTRDDYSSRLLIDAGAVFHLAQLVIPADDVTPSLKKCVDARQIAALIALRLLYSVNYHRKRFMRLFGNVLFEWFVDVGNFKIEPKYYKILLENLHKLPSAELAALRQQMAVEEVAKERRVAEYKVLDELGAGSFGTVMRVQDTTTGLYYALKELHFSRNVGKFGNSDEEKRKVVKDYIAEVGVVSAELSHSNVVRYYKAFQKGDHLFVVMKLIDGTTLGNAMTNMKEKQEQFGDTRITHITLQLVSALYYIHKTKRMIHRDIKPANVMLGPGDHVTLTDFGLAQCKPSDSSVLSTAVGTLMYQSPEVMKSERYTDKTDIWAVGCLIYQMVTLEPPFQHENNFVLMQKIEAADYRSIPDGACSSNIADLVKRCLQTDQELRIDVVELGSLMKDPFLSWHNRQAAQLYRLEKRLERETELRHLLAQRTSEQAVELKWSASEFKQLHAVKEFYRKKSESLEEMLASTPSALRKQTGIQSPTRPTSDLDLGASPVSRSRTPSGGSIDSVFSPVKPATRSTTPLYSLSSSSIEVPRGPSIHRRPSVTARSPSTASVSSANGNGGRHSPMQDSTRPKSGGLNHSANIVYIPRERPMQSVDHGLEVLEVFQKMGQIRDLPPSDVLNVPRRVVHRYHQALMLPMPPTLLKEELEKLVCGSPDILDINELAQRNPRQKAKSRSTQGSTRHAERERVAAPSQVTYADVQAMIDELLPQTVAGTTRPPNTALAIAKRPDKEPDDAARRGVIHLPPIHDDESTTATSRGHHS